jgi:O-Antigen ligase
MFAMPGIILLVAAIYARPQEIVGPLESLPLLHVLFGLALAGAVLDVRLRHTRLQLTPIFPWMFGFVAWAFSTVLLRSAKAPLQLRELAICAALYLLIAHGVQSFRGLGAVAATVLAMVLLVCGVAVAQAFAPTGCIQIDELHESDTSSGTYDGRPCETSADCYRGEVEPGAEYACEHAGWFGTSTVGHGRIRYRGVLQDPNELALAGAIGLPLAFALSRVLRKSFARRALLVLSFALILLCAVLTRSRGGQLVFLAVLAVPFARRFGLRGLLLGAVFAAPVLLFGGRTSNEAVTSGLERADCWAEALSIWRSHPLLGAGLGQFGRYHYLTAHNSYLLALAELGLPGMLLFSGLLYSAIKIPLIAWRQCLRAGSALSADSARVVVLPWAMAMVAALAGLSVGIFFLSFAYHYVLWIYVGLSGALYAAIVRHDPEFRVSFGLKDAAIVAAADFLVLLSVWVYVKLAFA